MTKKLLVAACIALAFGGAAFAKERPAPRAQDGRSAAERRHERPQKPKEKCTCHAAQDHGKDAPAARRTPRPAPSARADRKPADHDSRPSPDAPRAKSHGTGKGRPAAQGRARQRRPGAPGEGELAVPENVRQEDGEGTAQE